MLRLLLEDITLLKDKELTLHVRFKGGATRTLTQAKSLSAPKLRQTSRHIVQEIDRLLQDHSDGQVASQLNHRGLTSGTGQAFTRRIVAKIRRTYNLKTPCQRLREAGLKVIAEGGSQCDFHYPNFEAFWRAQTSAGNYQPALQAVGPDRLRQIVGEALRPYTHADGAIVLKNVYRWAAGQQDDHLQ